MRERFRKFNHVERPESLLSVVDVAVNERM